LIPGHDGPCQGNLKPRKGATRNYSRPSGGEAKHDHDGRRGAFFIDRDVNPELAQLPRWTFARALIEEAIKTGKSRDIKAAFRQLKQALGNEKWLDQSTGQAARK
jgi:hypothetical protein